jgi:hypothetical protein
VWCSNILKVFFRNTSLAPRKADRDLLSEEIIAVIHDPSEGTGRLGLWLSLGKEE